MIITPSFVFIHLHKTGGQFINRALLTFMTDAHQIGYHYPRALLPESFQHLPVIGFIRNPWSWYVSWYAINQYRPNGNPLFKIMSNNDQYDFDQTLQNMLTFGDHDQASKQRRDKLSQLLPDTIEGNRGIGLTKSCLADTEGSFYQWQFKRMFAVEGKYDEVIFGKIESLRQDLINILQQLDTNPSTALQEYILQSEPINAIPHQPYQGYYNEDLKQQVAEGESEIILKFNYQFEAV